MYRLFICILLLVLVLAGAGCAKPEEDLIKDTVINYNKSLVIALKSDIDILKNVATDRERGRIEIFKAQLAAENKLVDSRLEKVSIKSQKILDEKEWQKMLAGYSLEHRQDLRIPAEGSLAMYNNGAVVQTEELWKYQYIDTGSGKRIGKTQSLGYDVSYIMVKEDGRWKVADIKFEEKTAR